MQAWLPRAFSKRSFVLSIIWFFPSAKLKRTSIAQAQSSVFTKTNSRVITCPTAKATQSLIKKQTAQLGTYFPGIIAPIRIDNRSHRMALGIGLETPKKKCSHGFETSLEKEINVMHYRELLAVSGLLFIAMIFGAITIPFIRRRRDLLLPSTFFFLGSAIYIGYAMIQLSLKPSYDMLFRLDVDDVFFYLLGVLAFFVPLFIFFFYSSRGCRWLAHNVDWKWPPVSPISLISISIVGIGFSVLFFVAIPMPVLKELSSIIGRNAPTFALTIALVAWLHDRKNPVWLIIAITILIYALIVAVLSGGGRRAFASTLLAIPIVYYWHVARYKFTPWQTLRTFAIFSFIALIIITAYSEIRRDNLKTGEKRDVAWAVRTLKRIPSEITDVDRMIHNADFQVFGQRTVEMSMLCRRLYGSGALPRRWFHSVKFVLAVPIPRYFWPEKPKGLGRLLPDDYRARGTKATWGPGVIGHGFHDGGFIVLIVYGAATGFILCLFDEYIITHPQNPYLLGIFVCSSSNILGWTRGDISTFSVQIIGSIMTGLLLTLVGRLVTGTSRRRQPRRFLTRLVHIKTDTIQQHVSS